MGHPTQWQEHQEDLNSDSLKWEEFFGTSVDIASVLLDMYDSLLAKNKAEKVEHPPRIVTMRDKSGVRDTRCYSDPRAGHYHEKKRPLSTSSVSSSSSSSSSSLPRNDVKKSYLASIESLEDDEFSEDGSRSQTNNSTPNQQMGRAKWCDPNLSHIDRVLLEIVETERTYVRDLNQIIQGYLHHISSHKETKISQQNLIDLFSNIEDIYQFNSTFLDELEKCGLDPVAVARCFVKNSSGFVIYTQYCTNYPKTVSILTDTMRNAETAEVLKERQTALHHSLPLGSYLLKPVQRILKYHLLLQNIVKNSDKETEGYADIKNALSVMTGIAYHINDMKRKHEHAVRVQEIQSLLYGWEGQDLTTYGELVAEGTFRMFRAKALRHLFLFDKMLLIAKKREEGILCYKTHIMCSNLMLIESIQGEPLCFHVIPFDNPRFQYTFQTRNLEQKREWCLQLKRVILENYNAVIPSHARQLVMELGQNRQEDGSIEKSTSRRLLSAPEYLERRKNERRKSEISLNRAFRLKRGTRKGNLLTPKTSPAVNRKERQQDILEQDSTADDQNSDNGEKYSETKNDTKQTPKNLDNNKLARNGNHLLSVDDKNPQNSERNGRKDHSRHNWKAWNSFPGETTDTEPEDCLERIDLYHLLQYRPSTQSISESKILERSDDQSGEYVTFFFANSHARRTEESNLDLTDESYVSGEFDIQDIEEMQHQNSVNNLAVSKSVDTLSMCVIPDKENLKSEINKNKSDSLKSIENIQEKTILQRKHGNGENETPTKLWKNNAAIRRVQSFTGMAKAKVASLQHTLSFRQSASVGNTPRKSIAELPPKKPNSLHLPFHSQRLPSLEDLSPITPESWLKLQHEHLAKSCAKCGSLPRSFQLNQESSTYSKESFMPNSLPNSPDTNQKPKLRIGIKTQYSEQRPHTIASDKPQNVEMNDEFENYINPPSSERSFSITGDEEQDTTGCTNTPALSMENVHSIHPEHKIYHQAASKYIALKNVFCNVSSKLAGLKATIAPHLLSDYTDSCSNISISSDCSIRHDGFDKSSSQSSIRIEKDLSPKVLTTKLVQSVAKAYTSVIKQHLKKHDGNKKLVNPSVYFTPPKLPLPFYKQGSSAIGARMACPLESEYSVPKNCTPVQQTKYTKDADLRPDSLFSESSSEGDKTLTRENASLAASGFKLLDDDHEDTPSETSDTSIDSYYERTFDAIESVFTDEIFRDSAIYSDPEDADFSNGESSLNSDSFSRKESRQTTTNMNRNNTSDSSLELLCKRPVNKAIIERLQILEANAKFRKNNLFGFSEDSKSNRSRNADAENCHNCLQDCESETSSEHSASTVLTVTPSSPVNNAIKTQTRAKGWVKHVVDKFQSESYSG
ncbi:uncharacterized protein LOC111634594 isoform X1 [Centruroides sculpturatus]|uniref:uncharacterized protein LOC111634594 isoform X1 n=2 Tax=Centruroides sculpturatus TaxID=218467 RepID=UPI000C6DA51F|nr:uncharacterized protein LOC111634594 isoform X1 [Centruroides sculpturatus]